MGFNLKRLFILSITTLIVLSPLIIFDYFKLCKDRKVFFYTKTTWLK